ncbi:uncharacterized protein IL334_003186 [Kwoniella shivajii]|uniref:TEA domain-containing protein n=1 Tax=Kwoniella shivajii TaxID=564305 RepID=A0ABZ1CWV1_9TREE|nr:hypothetical protein IL334_003186 [Kwoniella shivajii]
MATWTGSPISVEEVFHQVWKSSVEIQPCFYFPSSEKGVLPSPALASPTSTSECSTEDELATAEILARIKFGSSSPLGESRKRSIPSSVGDDEDDKCLIIKRKKENSVESSTGRESGGLERWPPRKEFVYLTCVVAIPPVGRQKLPLFGKPCGRNEIIAKVVTLATGEPCSRKLISSHAQVLKGRKELSKQLRDLLTTEEGKNNDDEAAPTVYTLGSDWNFPKCLNRLIGLPENQDLRTSSPPQSILDHFGDSSKSLKSIASKKDKPTPAKTNRLTIKTGRPSKSLSPSVFTASIKGENEVHLPTPKSSQLPSPGLQSTPFIGRDNSRRPSLPSPRDIFSPHYRMTTTPRRIPDFSTTSPVPRRPATVQGFTRSYNRLLPLPEPESPISRTCGTSLFFQTPPARRTSESHLTYSLGKLYSTFEKECLRLKDTTPSGVSVEDIKRTERGKDHYRWF